MRKTTHGFGYIVKKKVKKSEKKNKQYKLNKIEENTAYAMYTDQNQGCDSILRLVF